MVRLSLKWQGLNYAGRGSFDLCLSQNPREVKKELRDFPVFSSAFSDLSARGSVVTLRIQGDVAPSKVTFSLGEVSLTEDIREVSWDLPASYSL